MPALPYIDGYDFHFDDAVVGAGTYQLQRSRDVFGLKNWENAGSPSATSPIDFESYVLTTGMCLRVLPMSGASIVAQPSDAVYFNPQHTGSDPASILGNNLELSFQRMVHNVFATAGLSFVYNGTDDPMSVAVSPALIDYDDDDFETDGKPAWVSIVFLGTEGRVTSKTPVQVAFCSREPQDRFHEIPRRLRDLWRSVIDRVEGYDFFDFSTPAAPRSVNCRSRGVAMQFAPRFREESPLFRDESGVYQIVLTYDLFFFREAAVP